MSPPRKTQGPELWTTSLCKGKKKGENLFRDPSTRGKKLQERTRSRLAKGVAVSFCSKEYLITKKKTRALYFLLVRTVTHPLPPGSSR